MRGLLWAGGAGLPASGPWAAGDGLRHSKQDTRMHMPEKWQLEHQIFWQER